MTISKKWLVQFLKQTLEGWLFAAYVVRVKARSVLAVGESYWRAVQKQEGGRGHVRCPTDLKVTAVPVPKGCGRLLDISSQLYHLLFQAAPVGSPCHFSLGHLEWSSCGLVCIYGMLYRLHDSDTFVGHLGNLTFWNAFFSEKGGGKGCFVRIVLK